MNRILLPLTIASMACASAGAGPVIGVFAQPRQGTTYLGTPGTGVAGFRSFIVTDFPGVTFRDMPTLTTAALDGCDAVILFSAYAGQQAITPLTAGEQSALGAYVRAGGGALVFTDNDTFGGAVSPAANNSLLAPFGLQCGGTGAPWGQAATFITTLPPGTAADGPHGDNAAFNVGWSGWISNAPSVPNLAVLATLNQNGMPVMGQYEHGALAPGSGRTVFFADTTMVVDGYFPATNADTVRNALAFILPTRCGPADVGHQGGLPGPDNTLDNNDFVVFIDFFFNRSPAADRGSTGGQPGSDGAYDNNDFIVFIDQFFDGCA